MTIDQLTNIFTYHAPSDDQKALYEEIRADARAFALTLNDLCPESREKSLALTRLQECVMMANASIALHDRDGGI